MPNHTVNHGVLYADRGAGNYVAFACAQEINFLEEQDTHETTIITSGIDKTFIGGGMTRRASFRGLFYLKDADGKWIALELFTNAIRAAGLNIRILYKDTEGFQQSISCAVIIPSKSIGIVAGQIAKTSIEMLVSGALTLSAITNDLLILAEDSAEILTEWGEYINTE